MAHICPSQAFLPDCKSYFFLPGTYGTGLLRNHALNGVFSELSEMGMPKEFVTVFKDSIDCNLYFSINASV